ncbi:MAG: hypothetical protein ACKV2V_04380 [Blastocatellia bacterium]
MNDSANPTTDQAKQQDAHDLEIIDRQSAQLNEEAIDILAYQISIYEQ